MKIIKTTDYNDMSRKAAHIISAQIIYKPNSVIGLATGSTPLQTYNYLIDWYKKGDLDFSQVTTFNLDEYYGLTKLNKQSYYYFMQDKLFNHININPDNVHIPDGTNQNVEQECLKYEKAILDAGGIDLQLLGCGHNGHIGFNEPSDVFNTDTHLVNLTESTIQANKRFFESEDDVPRKSYTIGIKTIMNAQKILMIVSGESKKEIVKKAFFGPVTPMVPASILQLHRDFTLVVDEDAFSLCE
ncbi:MAG TPA: glucosamine-6-phosphate deaminase [Clostridiales bacterium]|nr:glucosamine-6-phosphate deaminase [Clostridiales bacterium]